MKSHTLLYLPLVAVIAGVAGYVGGREGGGPLTIGAPQDTMYDAGAAQARPGAAPGADLEAGDVLALKPGTHPPLALSGLRGTGEAPILVTSADPDRPAVLDGLSLRDSQHVRVEGVALRPAGGRGAVVVAASGHVSLVDLSIAGAPGEGTVGVDVRRSVAVTLEDSDIEGFATAVAFDGTDGAVLRANHIGGATGAVVTVRDGAWVTVEDNRLDAGGHDAEDRPSIQLVGQAGADGAPGLTDATVAGNTLGGSEARPARIVATGALRDVSFEGNRLEHPARQAIVVGAADGVVMRANALIGGPEAERAEIVVASAATRVERAGNVARGASGEARALDVDRALAEAEAGAALAWSERLDLNEHVPDLTDQTPIIGGTSFVAPRYGWEQAPLQAGTTRFDLPRRMRFDAATGEMLTYDAVGDPDHVETLGRHLGRIGDGRDGFDVPREFVRSFFDAEAFIFDIRLRAVPDRSAWGQFMRIHMSMEMGVTDQGHLTVSLGTIDARPVTLKVKDANLLDGGWHDVRVGYDARSGEVWAEVDGGARARASTRGRTRPPEHWSLHVGNPFGDRKEMDGEVSLIQLSAIGAN
ncbi:right-handed parallel beta-helix repeat-containing protein [Jannaschia sp. Os4]|uniref:right-handed parallel beta-helix repeat-containing protein n=1 Tax=Jannaschia sp. Os4 TaxID=2807617 RepID=UPI00193AA9A9|nr:right-handed parallel beta-helix repeat-containing protein [Jannaschia sp. Os4]MBM2575146.1 right-handed parallel beta-helix repeat-containing protein [Jannaschia sp. Os4]